MGDPRFAKLPWSAMFPKVFTVERIGAIAFPSELPLYNVRTRSPNHNCLGSNLKSVGCRLVPKYGCFPSTNPFSASSFRGTHTMVSNADGLVELLEALEGDLLATRPRTLSSFHVGAVWWGWWGWRGNTGECTISGDDRFSNPWSDLSKNAGAIANHKYFHPMHIASKNLWKRELNTTNITDYEHIVAALLYYFRPLVILKWHAFSAQSPDAFKVVLEDGGVVLTFCMTSWTSMAGTTNQEETDFPKPSPWMCYEFIGWRTREGYHLGGKLVSFPISSVSIVSYLGWISFIIPSKGCSYQ